MSGTVGLYTSPSQGTGGGPHGVGNDVTGTLPWQNRTPSVGTHGTRPNAVTPVFAFDGDVLAFDGVVVASAP
ncbi:MAG TPA: hypothetical protein VFJ79_08470, partial [Acidimicrobiales bacterium]|nr:hypothetical protein [Acidimicrobiales bacterium]